MLAGTLVLEASGYVFLFGLWLLVGLASGMDGYKG
jgi:hypothetical protein